MLNTRAIRFSFWTVVVMISAIAHPQLANAQTGVGKNQTHSAAATAANGNSLMPLYCPKDEPLFMMVWRNSVSPRKNRFDDFDTVVLDAPTPLPERVLLLTSESRYAADIAYYLAGNRQEAASISTMSMLDAAAALRDLETRLSTEAS